MVAGAPRHATRRERPDRGHSQQEKVPFPGEGGRGAKKPNRCHGSGHEEYAWNGGASNACSWREVVGCTSDGTLSVYVSEIAIYPLSPVVFWFLFFPLRDVLKCS